MESLNQSSDTLRGSDNEDALHEDQVRLEDTATNLDNQDDELQEQLKRLKEQTNRLKELLKQSKVEKQQLQTELGRYQFLEDKQRRSKRQLLSRTSSSGESRLCTGITSAHPTLSHIETLPSRAAPDLHDDSTKRSPGNAQQEKKKARQEK